jgi:fermentation-respiration switch protein FrsA (DUF1100 family)
MSGVDFDLPSNQLGRSGWRRFGQSVLRIARPVLIFYLSVVLLLMFLETWLVYPVPPLERGDWRPAGLSYEDAWFKSADGTKLHGWFVPHPNARRAILYCHGNAEQVGDNVDLVAQLRDMLQASIFIFDYRGYGHSQGRPSEAGCIADARAAQNWLASKVGIPPHQIVLMGRSLGGGVAAALAGDTGAQALVLENAFPSAVDVAALHFPWLPVRWLLANRYDSLSRIKSYDGLVFQVHGARDTLVPIQLGRRLFDAAPCSTKQFLAIPDRGHNDPWPDSYYVELARFLDHATTKQARANRAE